MIYTEKQNKNDFITQQIKDDIHNKVYSFYE